MNFYQDEDELVVTDQSSIDEAQATGRWIRFDPDGGEGHV